MNKNIIKIILVTAGAVLINLFSGTKNRLLIRYCSRGQSMGTTIAGLLYAVITTRKSLYKLNTPLETSIVILLS